MTALALRGLRIYAPNARAELVTQRVTHALSWLTKSRPADTEDRVFRLWGLKYAAASPEAIEAAVKDLLATQRGDGGWAQIEALASDAYATGSALVSLHQAGGLSTNDPAYGRRCRLPVSHAEGRRDLVRRFAVPGLPALFREWLPVRQGPVHRGRRERLGRRGAGACAPPAR